MSVLPQAVVFDLDGVVTFTARVHLAAWKELFDGYLRARAEAEAAQDDPSFLPFTEADYRAHVDGRPRYDGVRGFLASRGIQLPEGTEDDPPGRESVRSLGDEKNRIFHERLRRDGVDADPDAVRLVEDLKREGVRVGVASSSRNVETILDAADLDELFDARVDGVLAADLGLQGKPRPDVFLTCLERLGGAGAERSAVVEDAVAGVQAGRAGDFGLVLAVDRGEGAIELREAGADWVVRDFQNVTAGRLRSWLEGREHGRPNALAHWADVARELEGRAPAVFLDYDGTLTPIADRPELATLSKEMKETLLGLAPTWPTTIVSGRGRRDVEEKVGVRRINFAGSHGFDISGPEAGGALRLEVARELEPAVAEVAETLRERTKGIPGALIEDKKYAVAVHYRLVDEPLVRNLERAVDEALEGHPELKKAFGKKVFELRPSIEWDKGRAVLWLLEALGLDRTPVCPIYVGDDVTDEDAFGVLEERGIGIVVTEMPRPTAARYSLQDVREVRELLDRIARWTREGEG